MDTTLAEALEAIRKRAADAKWLATQADATAGDEQAWEQWTTVCLRTVRAAKAAGASMQMIRQAAAGAA